MSALMLDEDKTKTILITGCGGFIGSHIAEKCLEMGWTVIGIDSMITGLSTNLDLLRPHSSFHFLPIDVRNINEHAGIPKVDLICHQAALGSVPRSIVHPEATLENNVDGFLAVLEYARLNKVSKVVYASSSSVYGDSGHNTKFVGEEGEPLSPYATSKKVNEEYAKIYSKTYGITTIGLRYFNVYGPRQNPNGDYAAVIPKWVDLVKREQDLEIYGSGEQSRDFTYVKDVVQANIKALTTKREIKSEIFNIGTGLNTSLDHLSHLIHVVLEKPYNKRVYLPQRKGDVMMSRAGYGETTSMIDYFPRYNLENGLKDMLGKPLGEFMATTAFITKFNNVEVRP